MIASVLKKIEAYNRNLNQAGLLQAYDLAEKRLKSLGGDVTHALAVVKKLLLLRPDDDTLIAALLHDLYAAHHLDEADVRDRFGQNVVNMLNGLRHLSKLSFAQNDKKSQLEVLRKMFVTMAKDLRVIVVWLACRLHKLQNIEAFPELGDPLQVANETMQIYVPIASRLGIYRMKTRLEDISFKYLEPQEYLRVREQMERYGKLRKLSIDIMCGRLREFLHARGVEAKVSGRLKSVYSTHKKLGLKHLGSVDELYDFFAVRVVLPHTRDSADKLYGVLGLIHGEWRPLSNRFKDYVAVPKANGYKSLHTVVLGLAPKDMDQPVEIQIRDAEMHREAEYGVASHWVYKTSGSRDLRRVGSQVEWLKALESLQKVFVSDSEILQEVEVDIFKDRIFVLTPRGEVKDLPAGACPLDFAYAVHTDIGNHCVMAKVGGNLVPLDYELKNGDVVEIVTRPDAVPKLKWLALVKSGFAKSKIKAWFSGLNRDSHVKSGREFLNAQLERLHKPALDPHLSILKNYCGRELTFLEREHLVEEVGKGSQMASNVIRKVYPYERALPVQGYAVHVSDGPVEEKDVVVGGEEGLAIKFSACCMPRKGEPIIGYVTRQSRVSIHKNNCKLLRNLNPARILKVAWKGEVEQRARVGIKLRVASRSGLIPVITSTINALGVGVVDLRIGYEGNDVYTNSFLLEFDDLDKFDLLLDKLESVDGVMKVSKEDVFK